MAIVPGFGGYGLYLLFRRLLPADRGGVVGATGLAAGLSIGGAAVLGAMVSSASYIAAPAAIRVGLPEANPAYYLTASLGITFPFNLTLGIPLYLALAQWWGG